MGIRILSVGKIREKYLSMAVDEYAKRLGRYTKLEFIRVADEKTPDEAPEAVSLQIRRLEGERLLRYIREKDFD